MKLVLTDIIFEEKPSNIYQNFIDINNNEYLYYTNQNKLGKLYKSFNYVDFKEKKEDVLSHEEIDKIARKEFNKISNPILDFKYFIQFFDTICPMLIITSLCFSFFEHADDLKLGVLRVLNILLQLIILIIYIIRFNKFIEVKNFLFDNEDIYKNDTYFPHKVFNIDSFPLALSINIFIINTLYIAFPNHELCLKVSKNFLSFERETIIYFYIIFFFVSKFIFEIFDFVNDAKIINTYKNLIKNWELPPIKSIDLLTSIEKEESYNHLRWKDYIFQMERLNSYDYMNIYSSGYSKLCGKDNFGNNLYFPQNIDCPINDIFISESYDYLSGYSRLKLNYTHYLYYTNQLTEGKVLIDLRSSYNDDISLNPDKDSESYYFSTPFYEKIDFDSKYLYSINYLGVNSSLISKSEVKKFKKKMDIYNSLYISKIVFFCIEYILIIITFIAFVFEVFENCCYSSTSNLVILILVIITGVLYLLYFILIIVCLDFNRKYVLNFLNKINIDYKNRKIDYKWNVAVLFHSLFALIYVISYLIFEEKFEFYRHNYNDVSSSNRNKKRNISDIVIYNRNDTTNYVQKIKELKTKITGLNSEITNLNKKIVDITKERDILKKNNKENIKDNSTLKNTILDYKEVDDVEELKRIIKEKDDEIALLKENNKNLLENINEHKTVATALKKSITFNLNEGERLMCVIILSSDQKVHYPIICKSKQKFNEVENLLYDKFPEYKKGEYYFLLNGDKINKSMTLEENKIKDGAIITMTKYVMDDEENP